MAGCAIWKEDALFASTKAAVDVRNVKKKERCTDMGKKTRLAKPTRNQKEIIRKAGLITDTWLVEVETEEELSVVSKTSGRRRSIKKEG